MDNSVWVEFLNARLDEDEAVARVAVRGGSGEWAVRDAGDLWDVGQDDFPDHIVVPDEGITTSTEFAHIARHDPARALREVAAKRAILAEHGGGHDPCDAHDAWMRSIPCDTLLALAGIWASHPDYPGGLSGAAGGLRAHFVHW